MSILVAEICLVFSLMKLIRHCVSLAVCFASMATEAAGKADAGFGRELYEALHLSEGNRALMIFFLCEWLGTKSLWNNFNINFYVSFGVRTNNQLLVACALQRQ